MNCMCEWLVIKDVLFGTVIFFLSTLKSFLQPHKRFDDFLCLNDGTTDGTYATYKFVPEQLRHLSWFSQTRVKGLTTWRKKYKDNHIRYTLLS